MKKAVSLLMLVILCSVPFGCNEHKPVVVLEVGREAFEQGQKLKAKIGDSIVHDGEVSWTGGIRTVSWQCTGYLTELASDKANSGLLLAFSDETRDNQIEQIARHLGRMASSVTATPDDILGREWQNFQAIVPDPEEKIFLNAFNEGLRERGTLWTEEDFDRFSHQREDMWLENLRFYAAQPWAAEKIRVAATVESFHNYEFAFRYAESFKDQSYAEGLLRDLIQLDPALGGSYLFRYGEQLTDQPWSSDLFRWAFHEVYLKQEKVLAPCRREHWDACFMGEPRWHDVPVIARFDWGRQYLLEKGKKEPFGLLAVGDELLTTDPGFFFPLINAAKNVLSSKWRKRPDTSAETLAVSYVRKMEENGHLRVEIRQLKKESQRMEDCR